LIIDAGALGLLPLFEGFSGRGSQHAALAAAIIGLVLVGEAAAESSGSWYLVIPPLIPEREALIKAYTAASEDDVRAAVEGLPEERQVVLGTQGYLVFTIPDVCSGADTA